MIEEAENFFCAVSDDGITIRLGYNEVSERHFVLNAGDGHSACYTAPWGYFETYPPAEIVAMSILNLNIAGMEMNRAKGFDRKRIRRFVVDMYWMGRIAHDAHEPDDASDEQENEQANSDANSFEEVATTG